jgi:hypothetical protein
MHESRRPRRSSWEVVDAKEAARIQVERGVPEHETRSLQEPVELVQGGGACGIRP